MGILKDLANSLGITFEARETQERRPEPSYMMYVNTAHLKEGIGTGFGNTLCGTFTSLERATQYALFALEENKDDKWRHIQSFDLHDRFSVTNSGYAKDNWELTPNTKTWTYWKDDRATGPYLYDSEGKWLGWQKD